MIATEIEAYYHSLQQWMAGEPKLSDWANLLPEQYATCLDPKRYGDLPGWMDALASMSIPNNELLLDLKNSVSVAGANSDECIDLSHLRTALEQLIPWRKGPYDLFGVNLNCEWRSDWKWDRVVPHIDSLENHVVLDVGCGNGYHLWRMLGEGAYRAVGVDPSPRFFVQFQMIKKLLGTQHPVDLIPVGIESVPENMRYFDTVFSMGILYHRKSPIDHLQQLKQCLKPGGQVILETLVIEGGKEDVLVPSDRYAKMPNVWFVPSAEALCLWLEKCGYRNVRCVDLNQTSVEEQRKTEWMRFESLADFLDPNDANRTIEGYPAPTRAVIVANV